MKTAALTFCLVIGVPIQVLPQSRSFAPEYTADNQLVRPANYREWIFLSSGLGMTYGPAASPAGNPRFDNVFVHPDAYRAFLESGKWPDKTMFVLEVRTSRTEGSINRGGRFQSDVVAMEVEVKDEGRFPDRWAFFDFPAGANTAKPISRTSCMTCHSTNGAVDNTFVQFYPTLVDIAKAKGTFRSTATASATAHDVVLK